MEGVRVTRDTPVYLPKNQYRERERWWVGARPSYYYDSCKLLNHHSHPSLSTYCGEAVGLLPESHEGPYAL